MESTVFGLRKTPREGPLYPLALEVHLVRHAQAHDEDGVDSHGPELTPAGHQQARGVAKRLAGYHYNAIYCSDLTRARQTADTIARHHSDTEVTLTRDLREVCGSHTALTHSRLTVQSDRSLIEEKQAMQRVVSHLREEHSPGERVLIVSHGNITRSLIPLMGGLEPSNAPLMEIYNTSLCIVDCWSRNRAVLRLANCVSHLNKRLIT
jgi:broad specificity phosphatase PhoE